MTRLEMVRKKQAPQKVKRLYDIAEKQIGMVPNVLKVMASSPAVLKGFIRFNSALAEGKLPPKLRERISIAVAYFNKCHY